MAFYIYQNWLPNGLFNTSNLHISCKVEKFFKCSQDSIPSPSPSVKIRIMVGKVCLKCKEKTLLSINKLLKTKPFCFQKYFDTTHQCFFLLPQVNFTAKILNFHWRWRWWEQIQDIFLDVFYFIPRALIMIDFQ